jgi:hypothetical protein
MSRNDKAIRLLKNAIRKAETNLQLESSTDIRILINAEIEGYQSLINDFIEEELKCLEAKEQQE